MFLDINILNMYIDFRYLSRQAVKFSILIWSFLCNSSHMKGTVIESKQPERDTIAENREQGGTVGSTLINTHVRRRG